MNTGLIVDVETSGLSPDSNEIIEIGLIEFSYGDNPAILNSYSALQECSSPLSDEITQLTGINSEMLHGQSIDWQKVAKYFARAKIVIAHNMDFDRSFLIQRPELASLDIHWACSLNHINWQTHGFRSRALNYLAADHGFVNPFAHRALFDCATTFKLVVPYLKELSERSHEKEYEFAAVGAPFEKKDDLKGNGYQWSPAERVWKKRVFASDLEHERSFLMSAIYNGESRHSELLIP